MKLYLVKPDLLHYEQYNKMMDEWVKDGSQISLHSNQSRRQE